jgi:hypothetical protein
VAGLDGLRQRVSPITLAGEQILPVPSEMEDLFPDRGLVRGRILSCCGPAATATTLAVVAPAVVAGSWLAVIDVPTLGLDAASELGVPLDRIVAVDSGGIDCWADVVVAASDGFDLVITRVPDKLRAQVARTLPTRLRRHGTVMIVLGAPGGLGCDGVIDTTRSVWEGLGQGHGHLGRRTVDIQVTGRRYPGHHHRTVDFDSHRAGHPAGHPGSHPGSHLAGQLAG